MIKLWILRNKEDLPEEDDPWEPWFDKAFGFVIRAETEQEARAIANENAGDENRGMFLGRKKANTNAPWLDAKYSTCIELEPGQVAGLVMADVHAA